MIVYFRVIIQVNIGPPYDTFDYLANAAELAGKSIGYTDLRPPFLSFLTSIVFRFTDPSEVPIFIIDGILYALGSIGLFLFLKLRFNSLNSFLGSLIYATFPIVLTYVGVGYPDLPSVSISIWALYFTVLAVKRDSRCLLISFPLAMLAFLTKFNQALIVFPIFLYILINWHKINRKYLALGLVLSSIIIVPVLIFFNIKYGNTIFPFLDFYGSSQGSSVSEFHFDINTDTFFYLKLLPLVIGNGALMAIFTIIGGLLIGYIKLLMQKTSVPEFKFSFKENYIIKSSVIVLIAIFFISWGVSYLLNEILFFFILFGIFKLLKSGNKFDLDFLFLSWFGTFLIFISAYLVKDIRYFLMILPSFAYFLIRFLEIAENQVGLIKQRKLTFYIAPIIVLLIFVSTALYLPTIPDANVYSRSLNVNMEEACNWLINYDPDYKTEIVYSDIWPYTAWFLQMNVEKMPEFKGNEKYYPNLKNYSPTKEDSDSANHFLVENNAYYYFSIRNWTDLNNYTPINKFGYVTIYKKIV